MKVAPLVGTLAVLSAGGCSFLVDFPKEERAAGGSSSVSSSSSSGSAGTGGMPPMACIGTSSPASVDQETWRGVVVSPGKKSVVRSTGLLHLELEHKLLVYGNSTDGLDTFNINGADVFAVHIADTGPLELVMAGWPCLSAPSGASTRRLARFDSDLQFIVNATFATDPAMQATGWELTASSTPACPATSPDQFTVTGPPPTTTAADVPVFDIIQLPGDITTTPLNGVNGVALDVTWQTPVASGLGAGYGVIDFSMASPPVPPVSLAGTIHFVFMVDIDSGAFAIQPLSDLFVDTSTPHDSWSGAIAADEVGNAWFTGSSCPATGGCGGPQLFFGRTSFQDPSPTVLVQSAGGASAGTALRYVQGELLLGGRYASSLPLLDATLPSAAGTVPFVAAIDPKSQHVKWSFPDAFAISGFDPQRWYSVVDLAAAGTPECGALYVIGCSAPPTATVLDCATPEPGKTGFLTKLDLATGQPIWTEEIALGDPATDTFVPTAITASSDHVWVASTFSGAATGWGMSLVSGPSKESTVLRFPL